MRTSIKALAASALLAGVSFAATPAFAQETEAPSEVTVTGSVTMVTDYRFRGVSLSGGDPAIQGTINLNHSSGFYVGTWASSIRGGPVYGEQEVDLYGGWTGEVTPGLTADAGLLFYVYPGGKVGDANYFEPYASVTGTVGPAKIKVGGAYAWKQDSLGGDDNLYLYTNVDVGIPNTPVTVSGHIGYASGPQAPTFLSGLADDTAFDYSIGASATLFGPLTAGVAFIATDGPNVNDLTDNRVVGTLTAAF